MSKFHRPSRFLILLSSSTFFWLAASCFAQTALDEALGNGLSIYILKPEPDSEGYDVSLNNIGQMALAEQNPKAINVSTKLRQYYGDLATLKDSVILSVTQYLMAEAMPSEQDSSVRGLTGLSEEEWERTQALLDDGERTLFAVRTPEGVTALSTPTEVGLQPGSLTREGLAAAGVKSATGSSFASALSKLYPQLGIATQPASNPAAAIVEVEPQFNSFSQDMKKLFTSWL